SLPLALLLSISDDRRRLTLVVIEWKCFPATSAIRWSQDDRPSRGSSRRWPWVTSRFLTAEQLAEHMQISVETVWRYTREGKIPALRVGNHYRYDADEVIRALSSAGREVSTRGARAEEPNVGKKQQQPDLSISGQRRMTYEEFGKLPEQAGLQLIDGFLVKEPSPRYGHQAIIGELYLQMALHVNRWRLGKVILAPFDVVLADDQVLQPDIMFVTKERMHLIKENGLFGAPDLALEVLSPASRHIDTGRKR